MTEIVFVAHPDDEVLGCGGTIAKHVKEGKKVIIVIFSHGEGSEPLTDPKILTEKRVKESRRASALLGCKELIFLGLSDLKFIKEIEEPTTLKKIEDILKKYKPKAIFTHILDDPHPAHRAVANLIKKLVDELKLKTQIFTFTIALPFRFALRRQPRLYVDITETFKLKEKALKMFKSQKKWLLYYSLISLLKNWFAGFKAGCKYAEVFYKWD